MRKKTPSVWRPMTPDEIAYAKKLGRCRFSNVSHLVFARTLLRQANQAKPVITKKQAEVLHRLLQTYQAQVVKLK